MYAFNDCVGLSEIALPSSVTTLKSGAFAGCSNLTKFTAYGLTAIEGSATETIPRNMNMAIYGPLGNGILRDWLTALCSEPFQAKQVCRSVPFCSTQMTVPGS